MSSTTTWPTFMAKLMERQEVANRTLALRFEKPADSPFTPGQFVEVTLMNPAETDAEGNSRVFSIASAPHESFLMVTTRLRDTAFKRTLRTMPLSAEVRIEGPFGDLRLHKNQARPAVFLAGGIGITPIRSIVLHAAKQKLPHRIFLFYSNRRPEDAAFLQELDALQQENRNYRFIPTMTEMEKSQAHWQGETGHFTPGMLTKYLKPASPDATPIYYLTGPPGMVSGVRAMLIGAGIDEDDIRTEEFSGY
ncbi:MAG TPA: FAD-dependent oxidoreductase [Bryobacteraceae bacterium]|nr:FAD-dependent oxidoreductase [Bryobacteraceae bacterium]